MVTKPPHTMCETWAGTDCGVRILIDLGELMAWDSQLGQERVALLPMEAI